LIIYQIAQWTFAKVPDSVLGIYEMVAGVETTVVLQYGHVTACFAKYAQDVWQTHCWS
jgi:hypothetical protein